MAGATGLVAMRLSGRAVLVADFRYDVSEMRAVGDLSRSAPAWPILPYGSRWLARTSAG